MAWFKRLANVDCLSNEVRMKEIHRHYEMYTISIIPWNNDKDLWMMELYFFHRLILIII